MKLILFCFKAFLNFYKNASDIDELKFTFQRNGGGIYKRIDENRELLTLMQKHSPELLEAHPHIVDLISSHDQFFTEAAKLVTPKSYTFPPTKKFPRPFPLRAIK
ncbi:MAG: hypothetical protein ACTS9Y_01280 [Methylophilus sp.]|uniref:hypothetical protein n=1 Tax=Methylophilus sp. TaxID=29541 RepID=UPI003FA0EDE6